MLDTLISSAREARMILHAACPSPDILTAFMLLNMSAVMRSRV
jgi:hypothetical protein